VTVKRQADARLVSLNVGGVHEIQWQGRSVTTGIWKEPVSDRRRVRDVNVAGDDQADRRAHGGHTKALYAYAVEDYRWWSVQLGHGLSPGTFGENLTTEGMDLAAALVGERWRIGSVVLRVTEPRIPCYKLGIRMATRISPPGSRTLPGRGPIWPSRKKASWEQVTASRSCNDPDID
jgi:MOSC domain-containing protein YiiM